MRWGEPVTSNPARTDENGTPQDILTEYLGMCGPEEDPS